MRRGQCKSGLLRRPRRSHAGVGALLAAALVLLPAVLHGAAGAVRDLRPQRRAHVPPSLRSFLRSRFVSANGVAAALYLLLSAWVLLNPRRAAGAWRRLQGR